MRILSGADVAGLLSLDDYLEAAASAFRALAAGRTRSPAPMHIGCADGAFHAKGAWYAQRREYVALKLNGNFPRNPERFGLPTIQGAILLCDAGDGSVLALLDSIEITLRRTAAASVLAARALLPKGPLGVAICGCGVQGRAHAEAIHAALPLARVFAWDQDPVRAQRFAADLGGKLGVPFEAVSDLRDATLASQLVVCCTTATRAFLDLEHIAPGTVIAAVGADAAGKSEVTPRLMARARVIVDVLEQCLVMGDLHHAIAAGSMSAADVHAELADIVCGARAGRRDPEEIFVFDSTGTAILDAACAVLAHARAAQRELGIDMALGAP